ncbi:hypothetical protein ETU09_04810 [Apibacter muscae]|uniref:Uncharacterized protein n=1 Tax=Apibacter muscae TaxID=2509004 RepID=A0A563DEV3_9FLAO|nr:hypothetical protein [Apibacter muscae]TWP28642.1 hypothetical protein ETU09_04810 [Apibacter muscae]
MQLRKPIFPIKNNLLTYLDKYNKTTEISMLYEDLLRFKDYTVIEDKDGKDTLWLSVYYSQWEQEEIQQNLKIIYTYLHSDGDRTTLPFLKVESIEFCTFGNSKPFRIRVKNILNENYTNFYIKKADASRIYGLELEDLLSPHRVNYLVYKDTLIEEHILGIPGDIFIERHLPLCSDLEKSQIAKEFVKFNERCLLGLLGDMRSYNYVVVVTHDYDQIVYRIRSIDFDQQSYEGDLPFYMPQFFKENQLMLELIDEKLEANSVEQYRKEVRSVIAKRILNSFERYSDLISIMKEDHISTDEKINQLKLALYKLTYSYHFKHCDTMGEIVETGLNFIVKNYRKHN